MSDAEKLRRLRPTTITGIKSLAKKLKKIDGISHSQALEEAARSAGFVTYREALTQLGEGEQ